jgi:hypothetical protein
MLGLFDRRHDRRHSRVEVGAIDIGRSIPLEEFVSLSRVAGVRLISLQKHAGTDHAKIETLGDGFDNGPDIGARRDAAPTCLGRFQSLDAADHGGTSQPITERLSWVDPKSQ